MEPDPEMYLPFPPASPRTSSSPKKQLAQEFGDLLTEGLLCVVTLEEEY